MSGSSRSLSENDMLFHVLTGRTFEDGGNTYSSDITADYQIAQPRQGRFVHTNSTDNYINTGFKPADITADNPFEIIFKHKEAVSYIYSSMSDTTNNFKLLNYSSASSYYLYYGNGIAKEIFSYSNFTVDEWYKLQISSDGTNYILKFFDLDGTQIDTTRNVAIPTSTLPNDNIYLSIKRSNGSTTNYYSNDFAYLKLGGKEWYFNTEVGTYFAANDGTILTLTGTVSSTTTHLIDNKLSNPLNSSGYFIVPTDGTYSIHPRSSYYLKDAIVPQDPDNPDKAFAWQTDTKVDCTYKGQCSFAPKITSTTLLFPNCPEIYAEDVLLGGGKIYATTLTIADLTVNMDELDLVFCDVRGTPTELLGFSSARTTVSNPTILEVYYYLGYTYAWLFLRYWTDGNGDFVTDGNNQLVLA